MSFPTLDLLSASEEYQGLVGREEGEGEQEEGGWGAKEKWDGRGDRSLESDIILVVFWQVSSCSTTAAQFFSLTALCVLLYVHVHVSTTYMYMYFVLGRCSTNCADIYRDSVHK